MAVLAIVTTAGNLGVEHAQIYLAGRRFPLTALWANAGAVGAAVTGVVWCIGAVVTLALGGTTPGSIPGLWLWVALASCRCCCRPSTGRTLQIAGRARAAVGATLLGTALQTFARRGVRITGALSPFLVLVLSGVANLWTWAGTIVLGARAGLVSWRIDSCPQTGHRSGRAGSGGSTSAQPT